VTPYYEKEGITLYHGDNCDVLGTFARESIDLVVTSPPYDDLRTYGGHSWDFYGVAWQLKRVLKTGGVIVWVVNDKTEDGDETGTSFKQAMHFKEIGLRLHDTMVWNKGSFTGVGSVDVRYGPSTEFMFVLSNGKPSVFNPIRDRRNIYAGDVGKARTIRLPSGELIRKGHEGKVMDEFGIRFNVWDIAPEMSNANRFHPGQFPEDLARDHILSWSNEGDTVLDPFNGSGTTTKMARECGRKGIGIEINEAYCEIAKKRIEQSLLPCMAG
jgi:site-specific DNA-methyltransferase (adenine-specific)